MMQFPEMGQDAPHSRRIQLDQVNELRGSDAPLQALARQLKALSYRNMLAVAAALCDDWIDGGTPANITTMAGRILAAADSLERTK